MKRADIKAGEVYGYNESVSHVHHYRPVVVLSTDLYMVDRYSHEITRADRYHKVMSSGRASYGSAVGMLVVFPNFDSRNERYDALLERLLELATAEEAVQKLGRDSDSRALTDGEGDETVILGYYALLTHQRYLHGDYRTLRAALDEDERKRREYADEVERERKERVRRHNELASRLDALGLTGYHVQSYESPSHMVSIKVEDLEELLALAESAVRANKAAGIHAGGLEYPDVH